MEYSLQMVFITETSQETSITISEVWSYVNILDTKSQTFLCCTSS